MNMVGYAFTLFLLIAAGSALAEFKAGRVISIHDGDTLTLLLSDRTRVVIRLVDIDAPELGQPFGTRARRSLSQICGGREAQVQQAGKDEEERRLARVRCGGVDANAEQVRRGMAWVLVKYAPKDSPLLELEAEARRAERGLWADAAPVAPWKWRAAQEAKRQPEK
jgi:endonuclease YncB( thermonuclease family)